MKLIVAREFAFNPSHGHYGTFCFLESLFWYREKYRIWRSETFFQDDLIGSNWIDLSEIQLGGSLRYKLRDDQWRLARALVLLALLLGLGSKSTSLSAGIHTWVQAVWYDLFSSGVFLPFFSMLILSLPHLGLGFKSTSLSSDWCVRRPRQ